MDVQFPIIYIVIYILDLIIAHKHMTNKCI